MRCCILLFVSIYALIGSSQTHDYATRLVTPIKQLLFQQQRIDATEFTATVTEIWAISEVHIRNAELCKSCVEIVDAIIKLWRAGLSRTQLVQHLTQMCVLFQKFDKATCTGLMQIEIDGIAYMLNNRKDLDGQRVCSIYMQAYGCKDPKRIDWDVAIPPRPQNPPQTTVDDVTTTTSGSSSSTSARVLHLSDFHIDLRYTPGSNAKCVQALCCQNDSGAPSDPINAAGYWGDYNVCDIPWHLVIDCLNHINVTQDVDFVYYTGDIISHRSWDTTPERNEHDIRMLFDEFYATFQNVPVYPVLGNHEAHPTDFFYDTNGTNPSISTQWLFDVVADEWSKWLPKSALATIRHGGYYTLLIKPLLRIIALNSNVCFTSNLWLIYEDRDPFSQLEWLVHVLADAERAGELVHIIAHVPPADVRCLANWNDVYVKIVKRFAHIIRGQFNGHTHYDEFRVFYDDDTGKQVVNVAWNGASLTTFIGNNPSYRVYDIDFNDFSVLDYHEWSFNLTEANQAKQAPNWFKLYSFKDAYGIDSLSYASVADLMLRMERNETLLQLYNKFYTRASDVAEPCDTTCLQTRLCTIKNVRLHDALACET